MITAVIKDTGITTLKVAPSQVVAFKTYKYLFQSFTVSIDLLRSDGEVLVYGTLNTRSETFTDGMYCSHSVAKPER